MDNTMQDLFEKNLILQFIHVMCDCLNHWKRQLVFHFACNKEENIKRGINIQLALFFFK